MKRLLAILGIITTTPLDAQVSMDDFVSITVTVSNIKTERGGQLVIFVFGKNGFPKQHDKALLRCISPITQETTTVKVDVPRSGHFALKALHDENMDLLVTKNWTGVIPRDGMGFSNAARIRFAPPSFSDARITYQQGLVSNIKLQYF